MKKLKKVLALTVVFAMVLSTVAFAAVPNDVMGTDYEEAASVLGVLSIMQGDDGGFRPNDTITRAEFAAVVARALDLEDAAKVSGGTTEYADVPATHWAAGYINLASDMGIINGYGNGNFGPEDTVKYEQALTMIVRALGYEPAAKQKGGYPVGYLYIASNEGITDDVDAVSGTPALRGDVAQMVYNSLTVTLMEQEEYGDETTFKKNVNGDNLLTEYLEVDKYIGIVVENKAMNDDVDDDEVKIKKLELNDDKLKDEDQDTETFEIGETNADELLGYEVEFYANDDDVIISIIKTDENDVLVDKFDDLGTDTEDYFNYDDGDPDEFVYETDDDDEDIEEANIKVENKDDDTIFILNGKEVDYDQIAPGSSDSYDVDALTNGSECIEYTLINNDGDNDYDFVIAKAYEVLVVDDVELDDLEIYSKNDTANDLDLDDDDYIITITTVDGEEVELEDIEEWDVLAVARNDESESKADVYTIIVVNDTVEGYVEEVRGTYGDDLKVVIDGEEYDAPNSVDEDGDEMELELDDEGTFYLDLLGNIVAVDVTEGSSDSNYGYLLDSESSDEDFDTGRKFKILTATGDEVIYEADDEVDIDEEEEVDADKIYDENDAVIAGGTLLSNEQLIQYELNSNGEITEIYTADSDEFDLDTGDSDSNLEFNEETKKFSNGVLLGSDTLVFFISNTDDDDNDVYEAEDIAEDTNYDDVYVYREGSGKPDVVVIVSGDFPGASSDYEIAVVDRITSARNDSDDKVDKLYGYIKGEEVAQLAEDGLNIKADEGDIIYITYNSDGEIDDVEEYKFNYKGDAVAFAVYDKDSESITIWEDGDEESYTFADDYYVYKLDESADEFTVESYSDIKTVDKNKDNYSQVALGFNDDEQVEVVVIYSE